MPRIHNVQLGGCGRQDAEPEQKGVLGRLKRGAVHQSDATIPISSSLRLLSVLSVLRALGLAFVQMRSE